MSAKAAVILEDLRRALELSGSFTCVSVGAGMSNRFPRAELAMKALNPDVAKEWPATLRLVANLTIYAHCPGMQAVGEVLALADAARAALLADRFRHGNCRDTSAGAATELGPVLLEPPCRPPLVAVTIEIRCHFEE